MKLFITNKREFDSLNYTNSFRSYIHSFAYNELLVSISRNTIPTIILVPDSEDLEEIEGVFTFQQKKGEVYFYEYTIS